MAWGLNLVILCQNSNKAHPTSVIRQPQRRTSSVQIPVGESRQHSGRFCLVLAHLHLDEPLDVVYPGEEQICFKRRQFCRICSENYMFVVESFFGMWNMHEPLPPHHLSWWLGERKGSVKHGFNKQKSEISKLEIWSQRPNYEGWYISGPCLVGGGWGENQRPHHWWNTVCSNTM